MVESERALPPNTNNGADSLEIALSINDPELIAALSQHEEGPPRNEYALAALRLGILALKRAQHQIDADLIGAETTRLLAGINQALDNFFDPQSGRFSERVDRLIKQDGELEKLLRQQIGGDGSTLTRTLEAHLGKNSPFMDLLSTDESKGFLKSLSETLENRLQEQRKTILSEFTLDSKDSALSRLVTRVESSQKEITQEFSLDDEDSALSRMKAELTKLLAEQKQENTTFQQQVATQLAALAARKQEAQRSTRHGDDFETNVYEFARLDAQQAGDVPEATGNTVGIIKNSKVGDFVVTLNPEASAGGARIVGEAKEKAGYTLTEALSEIATARKNRDASVGIFVFSRRLAPEGLEAFGRYGVDIVVVWDAADPMTDVYLTAGLSVARALCARQVTAKPSAEIDPASVDAAIRDIEKQVAGFDEIKTLGDTIENNAGKIISRIKLMQKRIIEQVAALDEHVRRLREAGSGKEGTSNQ